MGQNHIFSSSLGSHHIISQILLLDPFIPRTHIGSAYATTFALFTSSHHQTPAAPQNSPPTLPEQALPLTSTALQVYVFHINFCSYNQTLHHLIMQAKIKILAGCSCLVIFLNI